MSRKKRKKKQRRTSEERGSKEWQQLVTLEAKARRNIEESRDPKTVASSRILLDRVSLFYPGGWRELEAGVIHLRLVEGEILEWRPRVGVSQWIGKLNELALFLVPQYKRISGTEQDELRQALDDRERAHQLVARERKRDPLFAQWKDLGSLESLLVSSDYFCTEQEELLRKSLRRQLSQSWDLLRKLVPSWRLIGLGNVDKMRPRIQLDVGYLTLELEWVLQPELPRRDPTKVRYHWINIVGLPSFRNKTKSSMTFHLAPAKAFDDCDLSLVLQRIENAADKVRLQVKPEPQMLAGVGRRMDLKSLGSLHSPVQPQPQGHAKLNLGGALGVDALEASFARGKQRLSDFKEGKDGS